jgi:16S rRNA (guanine527-N7)-methyltransferase
MARDWSSDVCSSDLAGRAAIPEDRRRFERYLDLFVRWNRTHRMTALESPSAIVRDLFLDSLLFLPLLPPRPLTVVDIGAGAGIPGLPMRLVEPGIALTLVESKRKRVSFLLAACRELGLSDVIVKEGRAEALVQSDAGLAGTFDAAVSRAVGPAPALFAVACKYLKPGGLFIAAGPPQPLVRRPFETIRVVVPGSRSRRVLLKAIKEG